MQQRRMAVWPRDVDHTETPCHATDLSKRQYPVIILTQIFESQCAAATKKVLVTKQTTMTMPP